MQTDKTRHDIWKEYQKISIPWFGYVISIAKSFVVYKTFRNHYNDDFIQSCAAIAMQAEIAYAEGKNDLEMRNLIGSLIREELKNWGFATKKDNYGNNATQYRDTREWETNIETYEQFGYDPCSAWKSSIPDKQLPKCGVPGCEKPGTYLDRKYVRLCNNHERYTALRRKRGDKDPYQGIENKYMPKYKTRRPYSRNNGFWQFIKTNISPEEWGHIWRWAKGIEKKLDMKTLEKIRSIWQDAVAELPEPLKKYKKVESLVFMDLTCETCGHEFEFDAMTKLEKNVDIPESCPDCGGRNISKRTQRVAYIISQYKKGALSKQDAALILGRHPDDIKKYGTIFQKKGIKELGLKLKDPYFKRFRTQVITHKPKKGGNIKKFSYFTH